ncbi:unnamed protein product [Lactuca virosa]|uniref:Uncharacterized protein n=1 Tax=Lactuca virosa TaxID=75947 RepID=A0AAU9NXZ7_9ASTR|nr:unnamed protein product [Lactuca virosa]
MDVVVVEPVSFRPERYLFTRVARHGFAMVTHGSVSISMKGSGAVMMQKGGNDSKKSSTPWVPDPVTQLTTSQRDKPP